MSMFWIAGQTASGGAVGTITFSSIPQTFTHLQIRCVAKSGVPFQNADQMGIRFNGDTTQANYSFHQLDGNGSAVDVYGSGGLYTWTVMTTAGTSPANLWGSGIIDVLDYSNANKNKTVRTFSGHDQNGAGRVGLRSGTWFSTAAITSFSMVFQTGAGIVDGSRFDLYGITTSQATGA
jgi:hypothetical protein